MSEIPSCCPKGVVWGVLVFQILISKSFMSRALGPFSPKTGQTGEGMNHGVGTENYEDSTSHQTGMDEAWDRPPPHW